jgi:carboxyl-terminal processing protease
VGHRSISAVCEQRSRGPYLSILRARSAKRIAKDPDFIELQKERGELRRTREAKSISLNEAERRREKAEFQARMEARKKERAARAATQPPTYEVTLKNVDSPGLGTPLKNPKLLAKAAVEFPTVEGDTQAGDAGLGDDVILRDTENILVDYIKLSSGGANSLIVNR